MKVEYQIEVGDKQWVDWISVDPRSSTIFSLDQLLTETKGFWHNLQVHCTAECCGIDAFSFTQKDLELATITQDRQEWIRRLKTLLKRLDRTGAPVLISQQFNQVMHRDSFYQLVHQVIISLENIERAAAENA